MKTIKLSNGRVLQVTETEVSAWPSEGAAERGDPANRLYRVQFDGLPVITRGDAARLTGIDASTIRHAADRGSIDQKKLPGVNLLFAKSFLRWVEGWPHPTGLRPEVESADGGEMCENCRRQPARWAGLCPACYMYRQRNGESRPEELWAS